MSFPDRIDQALQEGGVQRALEVTIAHFNAESGSVHLLEADGLLHLRASLGIPEPVLKLVGTIPVGKGMAGLAVERAAPVTACNIQTDTSGDVRPGARATGMEGAIVVPVLRGAEAAGALGIANRSERTFTDEETALLIEVGRRLIR
jgi:L-methionine (R)-S-oxide reductase